MRLRKAIPLLASAVVAAASTLAGYAYYEFPAKYFGDELVIGINGTLPGWSSPEENPTGFDIDIAEHLAAGLGYGSNHRFVVLTPSERVTALTDGKVQLVVANFSIDGKSWPDTQNARRDVVDFAGPYFVDKSGVMYSPEKVDAIDGRDLSPDNLCVSFGTTAMQYLHGKGTQEEQNRCFDRFKDKGDTKIVGVVTDQSILTAYTADAKVTPILRNDDERYPISVERYGVAMRKGVTGLCDRLEDLIKDYFEKKWYSAFGQYLSAVEKPSSHMPPDGVDRSLCR
ncbi:transporter substrate-binding domain-containing protein [Amycolatopsis sp. NPDC003865]